MEQQTVSIISDLKPIMDNFMKNRRQDLERLRKAFLAEDFNQIADIAHGLKGVLGSFGFIAGYRIADDLENAAKHSMPEKTDSFINSLGNYINTVQIEYT